jgi:5'-nucleotidase
MLVFQGDATDVTTSALTDLELATNAAGVLELGSIDFLVDDLTLPATIADTTATVTWATSDAAVITALGVVTTPTGASVTATLTASVTVGAVTVTKDFVVTVVDPASLYENTVTEALAIAVGESILVSGVVSAINLTYGLFIQDADGTAIYVKSTFDGAVVVGDSIVVRGTTGIWDSYGNSQQYLDSAVLIEDNNGENVIVIVTDQTATQIVDGHPANSSQTFTVDLVFDSVDTYGYAFFTGNGTMLITLKIADYMPTLETDYTFGDTITDVTFTVYDINYDNLRVVAVSLPVDDTPVVAVGTEVFFSEYIEGDGNNRAIEIYNPTDAAITLTGYTIDYYHNGDAAADYTVNFDLSGFTIQPGDVLLLCTDSFTAPGECDGIYTYGEDFSLNQSKVLFTTGDDAIALVKDGTIIDMIGVVGEQPSSGWVAGTGTTMDHSIVRDPSVTGPNPTWTPTEWIAYAIDTVVNAGAHTVTPPVT